MRCWQVEILSPLEMLRGSGDPNWQVCAADASSENRGSEPTSWILGAPELDRFPGEGRFLSADLIAEREREREIARFE